MDWQCNRARYVLGTILLTVCVHGQEPAPLKLTKHIDLAGVDAVAFGSDFYAGWPESIIKWWRAGRWARESAVPIKGFSTWPTWFQSPVDYPNLIEGMKRRGMKSDEIAKIAHGNWLRLFRQSFVPNSNRANT